jgi:hypothetical protein
MHHSSILYNFTETHNSDNRFPHIHIDDDDEIVVGSTSTHVFILPFKYSSFVTNSKVIYRQGLEVLLEKDSSSFTIEEPENPDHPMWGKTILTVKLTPEETLLFNQYVALLDTNVQLKIETENGDILYNKVNKIKVKLPLDARSKLLPGGKVKVITEADEYVDVRGYEAAIVDDPDIDAENIAYDVDILGTVGKMPTEDMIYGELLDTDFGIHSQSAQGD